MTKAREASDSAKEENYEIVRQHWLSEIERLEKLLEKVQKPWALIGSVYFWFSHRDSNQKPIKNQEQLEIVDSLEKLIKQYKEKEGLLQKELEEKVAINKTLKEQLQNNPGYHTLEFVEEKMEMKLDSFKETILTAIKELQKV